MESLELARRWWLIRWVMRRQLWLAIGGRPIDPSMPDRGRLTRSAVNDVAERTFSGFESLLEFANFDELDRRGNRLNVRLAVATVALYRALLDIGIPQSHACDLVADAGWRIYRSATRPLAAAAHLRSRQPQRRVEIVLELLLHFPFSAPGRPGYEVETWAEDDAMYTTWTCCPPHEFVRRLTREREDRGDLEAFRRSWCSYDWSLNDLLAGGDGDYSRPHTMSHGDSQCDMRWSTCVPNPTRASA